jgi:hypothetical protein
MRASDIRVDRGDRRHHGGSRRNQSPHGDRETGNPLACLKSLVTKATVSARGSRTPNTTESDASFAYR